MDQILLCGLSGSILLLRRVWWQPAIGQTTIPHDVIWNVIWHFWYRTIRFDSIRWEMMCEDMITNHYLSIRNEHVCSEQNQTESSMKWKCIRFDDFALKSRVITNAVECYVYEFLLMCMCIMQYNDIMQYKAPRGLKIGTFYILSSRYRNQSI